MREDCGRRGEGYRFNRGKEIDAWGREGEECMCG